MSDALEEHDGKVSIGGSDIINLRFAEYMGALAQGEQELDELVEVSTKPAQGIRWRSVLRRHPERDQGKRTEAGYSNKLHIPWSNCLPMIFFATCIL
ncbi:MAG: hypothetical protein AB2693_33320 [Candidatus Thiodiazotropha sp.]